MAAFKYWRITNIVVRTDNLDRSVAEIVFYKDLVTVPIVSASSNSQQSYTSSAVPNPDIANVIDGNSATFTHSDASLRGTDWAVDLTLTKPKSIDSIALQMRPNMESHWGQEWQTADIYVSNDGTTWRKYGKIEPRIAQMNLSLVTTPIITLGIITATTQIDGVITTGIEVALYDRLTRQLVEVQTSDNDGNVVFYGLNPSAEYYLHAITDDTYNAVTQDHIAGNYDELKAAGIL